MVGCLGPGRIARASSLYFPTCGRRSSEGPPLVDLADRQRSLQLRVWMAAIFVYGVHRRAARPV